MNSEQGLIGALLVRPNLIGGARACLEVDDLSGLASRTVYASMLRLWTSGALPNVTTIADDLEARGELVDIGGASTLIALMGATPSLRVDGYVQTILDNALRHRMTLVARDVERLAADRLISASDAYEQGKELLASIEVASTVPSEVVDVETFCAGEDRFDWLVPNLMERGERLLIVAGEATGKSTMCRQVAVCGAFGVHPFKSQFIDPFRVLLIDLENPVGMIRRKLRPMLVKGRELRPGADPSMLGIVCRPGGIDVTRRTDAQWFAAQLTAAKPDLVVAGPLYKMFSADDKWEQGARAVTTILDDLRTRLGFGLILETHAPQGFGGQRHLRPIGSSLWLRWPEFGLSFVPVEGHPHVIKLTTWKDRDERYWPSFLQRGGAWPWTPCRDPEGPGGQDPPPARRPARPSYDQEEF